VLGSYMRDSTLLCSLAGRMKCIEYRQQGKVKAVNKRPCNCHRLAVTIENDDLKECASYPYFERP
jgi:hypothetical protein